MYSEILPPFALNTPSPLHRQSKPGNHTLSLPFTFDEPIGMSKREMGEGKEDGPLNEFH